MHNVTTELILSQGVDETPMLSTLMWRLGLARDAAAHRAERARCLAERKSTVKVILSYDVEKVPAANMSINSLRKSRRGSRPRSLCTRMRERSREKN
jgi:hypothetical protein